MSSRFITCFAYVAPAISKARKLDDLQGLRDSKYRRRAAAIEPEALADFLRRGSASALGSSEIESREPKTDFRVFA